MKALPLFLIAVCFSLAVLGQSGAVPDAVRASSFLNRVSTNPSFKGPDILYGIPLPPGRVIGNNYLNEHWRTATILLYANDRLLEGYSVRYDIKLNELELQINSQVRVLPGKDVKSFVWQDSLSQEPVYFVNTKEYDSSEPLSGFMEVIVDGKLALLKQTTLYLQKANYNEAFNVGSRDDKILKKDAYYFLQDGKLHELPAKKKSLITLFGDKSGAIDRFIEINSLNIKNQSHLKLVFEHYKTL